MLFDQPHFPAPVPFLDLFFADNRCLRSVALGIVLTALIQSLLAGIGLYACGIPHPGLLTAVAFVLGIAQIGPLPVLLPSVIWLYWSTSAGWGTALMVWSLPVVILDNGRIWKMAGNNAVAYVRTAANACAILKSEPGQLAKRAMAVYRDRNGKAIAWQVRFETARWAEVEGMLK